VASQRTKKLIVICLLVAAVIAVAVWLFAMPSVTVNDVRKPETLVLRKSGGGTHVFALTVRGAGEITGKATVSLVLNGTPYKTEQLSGKVEFEWRGDWYSNTTEVRYEPVDVRGGNIVLKYKFHE
jgi:hypothetical protein